jgi:hypothetical protein
MWDQISVLWSHFLWLYLLGCYIIYSEIRVEEDRLMVEGQGGLTSVKVEVDRQQVEGQGSRPGKVKVEDIDNESTNKRSKCGHDMTD